MPSASLWALHPEKPAFFKQHTVDNSKLFLLLMFLLSVINKFMLGDEDIFIIITTQVNASVGQTHDRMPLVLKKSKSTSAVK